MNDDTLLAKARASSPLYEYFSLKAAEYRQWESASASGGRCSERMAKYERLALKALDAEVHLLLGD